MTDVLDARFRAAVQFIQSLPKSGSYQPSVSEKLLFYSLFKQATEGKCKGAKPAFYDVVGKAKWEAWNKLGDMSKDKAKQTYVDTLLTSARSYPTEDTAKKIIAAIEQATAAATAAAAAAASPAGAPKAKPAAGVEDAQASYGAEAYGVYAGDYDEDDEAGPQMMLEEMSLLDAVDAAGEGAAAAATTTTTTSTAASGKKVKIYGDLMSQPSRAVFWFCKMANVPHELQPVLIAKLQHRTPEFRKLHPGAKLPVIQDGDGFVLYESHTIMRYLCQRYGVAGDSWYPTDLQQRSLVDQALDWHHFNVRKPIATLVFALAIAPRLGVAVPAAVIAVAERDFVAAFKALERTLTSQRWLTPLAQPTLPDLVAYEEIVQCLMLGSAKWAELLKSYPAVAKFVAYFEALPGHADVHRVLLTVVKAGEAAKAKKSDAKSAKKAEKAEKAAAATPRAKL